MMDLALKKKPEPIRFVTKKFKLPANILKLMDDYKTAYIDLRPDEDISDDELLTLIVETQLDSDKGFKNWLKKNKSAMNGSANAVSNG